MNNKFKERYPLETIAIIKDFFKKRGYKIKEEILQKTECDTYYFRVNIYYDKIFVLGANGKGTTEDFCRASGYAELYERFCNICEYMCSPVFMDKYRYLSMEKKGYVFDKQENLFSQKSYNFESIKTFYEGLLLKNPFDEQNLLCKNYLSNITNHHLIEVPYVNIKDDQEKLYIDPRLIRRMNGSIGMAAGNSFEEAFNQGMSEICEIYVKHNFYQSNFDKYYAIDLSTITNQECKNIIDKIISLDYNLYILDLSYNYNLPVLMAVLVDKSNYKIRVNLGSFPVFDIALERILTELYQGYITHKDKIYNTQIPFKLYTPLTVSANLAPGEITSLECFPEEVLLKLNFTSFNKNVFLENNDNLDNLKINNYYIDLSNKLNFNIYYRDCSLTHKMTALQIITDKLNAGCSTINLYKNTSSLIKKSYLEFVNSYYLVADKLITNKTLDFDNMNILYNFLKENNSYLEYLFDLMWTDPLDPFPSFKGLLIYIVNLSEEIDMDLNKLIDIFENTTFEKPLKQYATLKEYSKNRLYDKEKLNNFLKTIFDWEPTDEDYENLNDNYYLCQKIYIEPLFEFLEGETFEKIVSTFIPN